jgi:hypothetical protein
MKFAEPACVAVTTSGARTVTPLAGGRTRFLVRARARYAPRWSWAVLGLPYALGDFFNTGSILRAVKHRAERARNDPAAEKGAPDGDVSDDAAPDRP